MARGGERRDLSLEARAKTLEYIRSDPTIRDVLLTGGDPLMHSDDYIEELLRELRKIEHVEIIRIGTRAPCTLPHRVTEELCRMLSRYHPLWVNTQFNHPAELTAEAREACRKLVDAGIPVGNQSVLLKGVNDDPAGHARKLLHGLVSMRVRPYYLFQCQTVAGTAHLRTPDRGRAGDHAEPARLHLGHRRAALRAGHSSWKGEPGAEPVVERTDDAVFVRSHDGRIWREPNQRAEPGGHRS